MAQPISIKQLEDASLDAISLSEFIFKPSGFKVERRLAPQIDTLEFYLDYLKGLQAVYEQEDGVVEVNGVEVIPVKQAIKDSVDDILLGDYKTYLEDKVDALPFEDGFLPDNSVSVIPNAVGAVRSNQSIKNSYTINVKDFGAQGDGVTDDTEAFFNCLNAFPLRAALDIYIPSGHYLIKKTLFVTRPHIIHGDGGAEKTGSILDFTGAELAPVSGQTVNSAGLWIYHFVNPNITLPTGQVGVYGAGSCISGITTIDSPANGIVVNAPATVKDCFSFRNAGDGLLITGGAGGGGNANHSYISHVKCASNGKSGIQASGSDANTFTVVGCTLHGNEHYGFNDQSLLGGVVIGCEADNNKLAAYNQRGGIADNSGEAYTPSRTIFIGCYTEDNQAVAYSLNGRGTVIGATGKLPKSTNYLTGSLGGMYSQSTVVVAATEQLAYDETADHAKLAAGEFRLGFSDGSKFKLYNNGLGYIALSTPFGNGNEILFRAVEDFNATITRGRPYFPNGFALSDRHSQTVSSTKPTTTASVTGNIVWNTSPAVGGYVGWVCTSSGSSESWKPFGKIEEA